MLKLDKIPNQYEQNTNQLNQLFYENQLKESQSTKIKSNLIMIEN